jgi:hypothetical protein
MLYANPHLSGGVVLSGDVREFELSRDWHGFRVTLDLLEETWRQGQVQDPVPGPLESLMWDALQSWPQPGVRDGRRWPPEMTALLALAERYPGEYAQLRDAEAVLRALGG